MKHQFNDQSLTWLYKFRSLSDASLLHTTRIITHSELYLSAPSLFNDPFDCKPGFVLNATKEELRNFAKSIIERNSVALTSEDLHEDVEKIVALLSNPEERTQTSEILNAAMQAVINKHGVCCLSEDWKSILMWSHYADSHKGICFRFKANSYTPLFGEAQRVRYADSFPAINVALDEHLSDALKILLTKSEQWAYEREWRIVDRQHGPGVRTFEPDALKAILLGMNIKQEHEALIRELAGRHPAKPSVKKIRPAPLKYELTI